MIINPIIPIPVMAIICIALLFFKRKGVVPYIIQILIIILLFTINLRVMIHQYDVPTSVYPVDVLFVVDNTISMLAEDYDGDGVRMDAVKEDVSNIIEEFQGARFSVISFANEGRRMTPYTSDYNMVMQAIKSLNGTAKYYGRGTTFEDVVNKMKMTLDNENRHRQIVFFISDGEITNNGKLGAFDKLAEFIDGGAVLGYGTDKGGYMKTVAYIGDQDEPQYITYYDDNFKEVKAVSCIDEGNLQEIADDMGIDYVHMKNHSSADKIIEKLLLESGEPMESDTMEGYADTYYWFVIPLLALLLIDFFYAKKKLEA